MISKHLCINMQNSSPGGRSLTQLLCCVTGIRINGTEKASLRVTLYLHSRERSVSRIIRL